MSSVVFLLLEIAIVVTALYVGDRWIRRSDRLEWRRRVATIEARLKALDEQLARPDLTPAQRQHLENRKAFCESLIAGPAWHWSHT